MSHRLLVLGVTFALALATTPSFGASLYVANDGTDSGTCGAKTSPCRSINQGITNAGIGDTVIVGPGRYGDLTGDGDFSDPGEEGGNTTSMITIAKRVRVLSSNGATATVIDANGGSDTAVTITAAGVVFGGPKKGFTLKGADLNGLFVSGFPNAVTVSGNLGLSNGNYGFVLTGTAAVVTNNVAMGNAFAGFQGSLLQSTVRGNVAIGNAGIGFNVSGTDLIFDRNTSTANSGDGFNVDGAGGASVLSGNAAVSNGNRGISLNSGAPTLRDLSAIGNGLYGLNLSGTAPAAQGGNEYGNRTCGLRNNEGITVTATKTYWGSPLGPLGTAICNVGGTSVTNSTPFATKPVKLKVKPLF